LQQEETHRQNEVYEQRRLAQMQLWLQRQELDLPENIIHSSLLDDIKMKLQV
jgi:hypothetical protein